MSTLEVGDLCATLPSFDAFSAFIRARNFLQSFITTHSLTSYKTLTHEGRDAPFALEVPQRAVGCISHDPLQNGRLVVNFFFWSSRWATTDIWKWATTLSHERGENSLEQTLGAMWSKLNFKNPVCAGTSKMHRKGLFKGAAQTFFHARTGFPGVGLPRVRARSACFHAIHRQKNGSQGPHWWLVCWVQAATRLVCFLKVMRHNVRKMMWVLILRGGHQGVSTSNTQFRCVRVHVRSGSEHKLHVEATRKRQFVSARTPCTMCERLAE